MVLLDILIERLFLMARYDIPCLSLAVMRVVNRVEEEVLDVPAKGGELHAHIHPRQRDSTDLLLLLPDDAQERGGRAVKIVEIEEIGLVLKISVEPIVDLSSWEPASILRAGQVGSVLHRYLIIFICVNSHLHYSLVTRFQYSCSRLDSSDSPLGLVLNL